MYEYVKWLRFTDSNNSMYTSYRRTFAICVLFMHVLSLVKSNYLFSVRFDFFLLQKEKCKCYRFYDGAAYIFIRNCWKSRSFKIKAKLKCIYSNRGHYTNDNHSHPIKHNLTVILFVRNIYRYRREWFGTYCTHVISPRRLVSMIRKRSTDRTTSVLRQNGNVFRVERRRASAYARLGWRLLNSPVV